MRALADLPPIRRESVADQVARRILDLVAARELRPGDQLPPERELAEALDVSRPSLREALRGLSILGILSSRQGGGHVVTALDAEAILKPIRFIMALEPSNLRALYDARSLIEGDVARRAAVALPDDEIDRLDRLVARQEADLHSADAFRRSDQAFHVALWRGCGNPFLHRIGESLFELGHELRRRASETVGIRDQSWRDHRRLMDAVRARDADAAAWAAAAHMRNVYASTAGDFEADFGLSPREGWEASRYQDEADGQVDGQVDVPGGEAGGTRGALAGEEGS